MKQTILFDAERLIAKFSNTSGRSGIFFVAYNVIQHLYQTQKFNIYLYFKNADLYVNYYYDFINDDIYKNFKIYNQYKNENLNDIVDLTIKKNKLTKQKKESKGIKKIIISLWRHFIKKKLKVKTKIRDNAFTDIDIFFSPMYAIPDFINNYPSIQKCIILHDTIPMIFPEYFFSKDNISNHWCTKLYNSLDKNTYCFCVSQSCKNDFLKYFGSKLDEKKMFVMPIATAQDFYPDKNEEKLKKVLDKYNVSKNQRGKYIFSLSNLEPRKGLLFTIKCFMEFIKENNIDDLYFYLGGKAWEEFQKILHTDIDIAGKDKVVRLGYVDDEDVNTLYSNSLFFTYISLYEGFGMPPLEAMSCGTPVLTSNTSSLPEVVGDAAIMIDPTDKKACIDAMKNLYFNENLRNELSKKGLEQAKKFSWDKTVDIIINKIKNQ